MCKTGECRKIHSQELRTLALQRNITWNRMRRSCRGKRERCRNICLDGLVSKAVTPKAYYIIDRAGAAKVDADWSPPARDSFPVLLCNIDRKRILFLRVRIPASYVGTYTILLVLM